MAPLNIPSLHVLDLYKVVLLLISFPIFFVQLVFGFYCFSYKAVTYGTDYEYPGWAEAMGLCMSFASMMWVPLYAIYYVLTQPGSFMEVKAF